MNFDLDKLLSNFDGHTIHTVCFTGSRPNKLKGYVTANYNDFVHDLSSILEAIYNRFGAKKFISGVAQGMDQLSFWAVYQLKNRTADASIQNILHVPFEGQDRLWAETGLFSKAEYRMIRQMADSTVIVTPSIDIDDKKMVYKALDDRNHSMVDTTDLVVALYPDNGWNTAKHSGTANCMQYAAKKQKPILQLMYDANADKNSPLIITGITSYLFT